MYRPTSYGKEEIRKRILLDPRVPELHCILAISILKDIFKYYIHLTSYYNPTYKSLFTLSSEVPSPGKLKSVSEVEPLSLFIEENWPIFPKDFNFLPWLFNDVSAETAQNQMDPEKKWHLYSFKKNIIEPSNFFYENRKRGFYEAKDELQLALALGLSNRLISAKARAYLAKVLVTIIVHEAPDTLDRIKDKKENILLINLVSVVEVKEVLLALIKDLKYYLRQFPYDLEALNLLKIAYKANNNKVELGRAIQAYNQAESLIKARLIPDNVITPFDIKIISQNSNVQKKQKNTGLDFEDRVKKLLESMGFIASTTKTTSDGGIDIIAFNQSPLLRGKYIIQCKDWKNPVGEPVLRDLYGLVLAEGANKGILMTSGDFTNAASKFSDGKPLELINGEELNKLTLDQSRKTR